MIRLPELRWLPLLATASVLGCEPTPHYATPEQPLVGTVEVEASLSVTAAGDALGFFYADWLQAYRLRIAIPAGAYPRGTIVTIRLLSNLSPTADTELALGRFVQGGSTRVQAFQVLPAALTPAGPLHVALVGAVNPWTFDVLHAREDASVWTVVGSVEPSTADSMLSFDIDAPGLWTIGQLPLPQSLEGHLQRIELACGGVPVSAPRGRALDLVRDSYRFGSPAAADCEQEDSGTIRDPYGPGCLVFDAGTGTSDAACFVLDPSGTGLSLRWERPGGPSNECPATEIETEHYVLAPSPSGDAGAPPTEGSRSPDAGGGNDGGHG